MHQIVECVPNFSEGRNKETIAAIADAIRSTEGCTLLDIDPGASTNRTVYTFVASPEAVVEGAMNAATAARAHIDMTRHSGEHPRFGAMDVCPFIPVANVTMAECAAIAAAFGQRLAETLGVPVFLYGHAARAAYRRSLSDVRHGEYEGLADRLKDEKWQPDFGPAAFVPAWGATATGARNFLIAYNVNILGTANQAHRIALNLREGGRGPMAPGRLKMVKGMGWQVDEYNMAQVTVNLEDYTVTPLHVLYEEVKKDAAQLNIGVAGSEIVGLVPLEAVLMAADHYIEKENLFIIDEDQKIRLVIERLGLNAISPFDPAKRIIDYVVAEPVVEPLAGMSTRHFVEAVAERSPAPGGGSVSALVAALGAALGAMVSKLTYGVRKFEDLDATMRTIIPPLHHLTAALIPLIDADTTAFEEYMTAMRLPKDSPEEQSIRSTAMEAGLKTAIRVPLRTMELGDQVWEPLREAAGTVNIASASDVQVGARCLETGIWGAWQNVLINMAGITDAGYKEKTLEKAAALARRAQHQRDAVLEIIRQRLDSPSDSPREKRP
jgi:glutamate formiminotransferase/formiminotetrahydrofolate cyclodeaminase